MYENSKIITNKRQNTQLDRDIHSGGRKGRKSGTPQDEVEGGVSTQRKAYPNLNRHRRTAGARRRGAKEVGLRDMLSWSGSMKRG
jgi:hypothetical protein